MRIERQTQTTTMKDNNRKKYNAIIINHENWLSKCLTWSKEKQYRGVCVVCVCVTDNNSYSSGGTPEARRSLLWSFCVSQSVTPPVLTRGGFNPPKANPRHKHESLDRQKTRQKQTDEASKPI